jgi:hypothetical protein
LIWLIPCAALVFLCTILISIQFFHACIKQAVAPVPSNRQDYMAGLESLKPSQARSYGRGALGPFAFHKVVALSLVFGLMTGIIGPGNPLAMWSSLGVGVVAANMSDSGWLEVLTTSVGSILVGNAVEWVLPEAFKNGKLLNYGPEQ